MLALHIIAVVVLGFMAVINMIVGLIGDDELQPLGWLNFAAMAFAIVTLAVAMGYGL